MRNVTTVLTALALVALPVAASTQAQQNIVQTAISAGSFDTLVQAIQAAGLVDALQADGPFTVFAPTDAAFAKLPAGTLESLLQPENVEQLRSILTYHVVPAAVMAANVSDGLEAQSLEGSTLSFAVDANGARVGAANIVGTDVQASNGVIHVIDTVLIPSR